MCFLTHYKASCCLAVLLIALLICVQDLVIMGRAYGDTRNRLDGKKKPSRDRDTQVSANLYHNLFLLNRLRFEKLRLLITVEVHVAAICCTRIVRPLITEGGNP